MEKTIAIIATEDTKGAELEFLKRFVNQNGFKALIIDTSTRPHNYGNADITAADVAQAGGFTIDSIYLVGSKAEKINMMQRSACALVTDLCLKGDIHAVLGLGGLQNSIINSSAMQTLPIGVPKVLLSTVACGNRTFGSLVGLKDIMILPSIADLAGLNPLTEVVLKNAAAAVMGMLQYAGETLKPTGLLIGATMMGATNDGIYRTIQQMEAQGYQVITFHSTGVGGSSLEALIDNGTIKAVMDLCLHEIVSQDVFNGGFSVGAENRLRGAAEKNLPMILSPAGLDFIDFSVNEFQSGIVGDPSKRKYTLHNNAIAHIKLFPDEAKLASQIVVDRLADYEGAGFMILPLLGLRSETRPGEKLHDPEVDEAIFSVFRRKLNKNIQIIELDAHLFDEEFSRLASDLMLGLLKGWND